jgi:hypothetical protein
MELPVKRYYFHVVSPAGRADDLVGRTLPGLSAVVGEALKSVRAIVHKEGSPFIDRNEWRGWSLDVSDGEQQSLLMLKFEDVIDSDGQVFPT